jgi:hypothetical protein
VIVKEDQGRVLRLGREKGSWPVTRHSVDLSIEVMKVVRYDDLPPLLVPSFKLELGSSQARDPGGA